MSECLISGYHYRSTASFLTQEPLLELEELFSSSPDIRPISKASSSSGFAINSSKAQDEDDPETLDSGKTLDSQTKSKNVPDDNTLETSRRNLKRKKDDEPGWLCGV